jgi:thiol:disulfide interchange protein/DsbC/DsbD-like thiol-disulfide interchange protein
MGRRMKWFLAALAMLGAAMAAPAMAQAVRTERVEAELHSARAAIAPGETFTVVLRQTITTDWHTYWRNPGDSGEPTELTWTTPAGYRVGDIQWPAPKALPYATFVNFGYDGEVLFPIEITAPRTARVGSDASFTVVAHWLVCSPEICVPEDATLTLSIPVEAQGRDDPTWAPRIAAALEALPSRLDGVSATITNTDPATLSVVLPSAANARDIRFFPYDRDAIEASAAQSPRVGVAGVSFSLSPGVADNLGDGPLAGVVAFDGQESGQWVRRGVEIEATPGEAIAATADRPATFSPDYALADLDGVATTAPEAPAMSAIALITALGFAFLGGLILNIMPCVLPVLSVKALSFAGGAHAGEARRHGLFYFAGVMATFLALAGLLIALRSAGEAVGWGFQLQAPWVTSALALLFFLIGLNLLGVFSIGGSLQNTGGALTARGGDAGSFFTGALAVVAATPCTAPFMAGAIGAALTQSATTSLLVFTALGLGFALPLTLLHFVPSLQRLIPKPGAWMERARNVLAFPMFAAAAWLAWVLAEQMGPLGITGLLSLMIAIAFALFVARWGRVWLVIGTLAIALTAAFTWRPLVGLETQAVLASEPWSPERVAELRGEGRGVFVNFTAAWCVTCKVNEGAALARPRVAQAMAQANVAYLKGDWTNRDDRIAAALAEHDRAGVPLYLYYPPEGDVVVLPQILTEDLVLETIEGASP